MQGTIGVPHGEVAIILSLTSFYEFAIGKLGVGAIRIAHLTRQERGPIQGAIELIHFGDV